MWTNYFKIAWRNILKRKYYSAINIFGLALGITCSIFLYLFISYHLSFDTYHKKAAHTFRVVNDLQLDKVIHEKGAPFAMYPALASGVGSITNAAVALNNNSFTITIDAGTAGERRFKEDKNIAIVSASWFNMFYYQWLSGNPAELNLPNTAVLSKTQAVKYFGEANPIGRSLVLDNRQTVKVVGLLDDSPANTDLKSPIFISLASLKNLYPDTYNDFTTAWSWINSTTAVYITINDQRSKPAVESAIGNMASTNLGDNARYYRFWLQPLSDVHFNADFGGAVQKSLLLTLMIIGVLVLIIASFNYINISIAQQSKRMAEIGTRKVLGGTSLQLFVQFITETFILVSIAVLIAIAATVVLLPVANRNLFAQEPIRFLSYANIALFIGILSLSLVALSGFYPAFVLSRVNIFRALKNRSGSWKAGVLRKSLVVVQNAVAYSFIICAVIMILQVKFLKNTDIGFNRDAVVMVPLPDTSQAKRAILKEALDQIPSVASFTFCAKPPSSESNFGGSVKYDTRQDWESWPALSPVGDTGYVRSFGLQIIAGKNFSETSATPEYLVNETLIRRLGLKNINEAIGKPIIAGQFNDRRGIITGVVKDFNTQSLQIPIAPVIIVNEPVKFQTVAIKAGSKAIPTMMAQVRQQWEAIYPKEVFKYSFLDDQIAALYQKENLQQQLVSLAGIVAITISCLGLLGLVSLITVQRTKEIGIRKVIGASVSSITMMLSKDFLQLILVSILLATPLAWWISDQWLQNFAYRIQVQWWVFVLAGLFSLVIAIATISYQAIRAALANPVDSLKTE